MTTLRHIPIRRSLNRPNLLLGAERELMLLTGMMTFALIFVALTPVIMGLGLLLWLVVIALLRLMAKADPELSKVYLRHVKYQEYYWPYSTPFTDK